MALCKNRVVWHKKLAKCNIIIIFDCKRWVVVFTSNSRSETDSCCTSWIHWGELWGGVWERWSAIRKGGFLCCERRSCCMVEYINIARGTTNPWVDTITEVALLVNQVLCFLVSRNLKSECWCRQKKDFEDRHRLLSPRFWSSGGRGLNQWLRGRDMPLNGARERGVSGANM